MTKYYDSGTSAFKDIPSAPYYVLSNDSFMSDWGAARSKINTCVVPCATWDEAVAVQHYVQSRREQKRVRIACSVRPKAHVVYSLVEGWKDRAKECA